MIIDQRPKGSGKTTDLIKYCTEHDSYLCVRDLDTADKIFHNAKEHHVNIRLPITYKDLASGSFRSAFPTCTICIDDIDSFLTYLAGHKVLKVTATTEEINNEY